MSWEDRERAKVLRRNKKNKEITEKTPEHEKNNSEIDEYFSITFSTPAGLKVLEYLRLTTKERMLAAGAPDSALRELEGKRHLVHEIETRIARGQKKDVRRFRTEQGHNTGRKHPEANNASFRWYPRWLARIFLGR